MSTSLARIPTPPSTTLSTPSPTELSTDPFTATTIMPASSAKHTLKNIYLIVATTPVTTSTGLCLGIGKNGSLPWPRIKADMDYFRKVTTDGRETSSSSTLDGSNSGVEIVNSVIMGRKTYESIPPSFRPLRDRRNYIVTRGNTSDLAEMYREDLVALQSKTIKAIQDSSTNDETPSSTSKQSTSTTFKTQLSNAEFTITTSDSSARLTSSNAVFPPLTITSTLSHAITDSDGSDRGGVFCIGGAEIYHLLLQDSSLRPRLRVLQTEIEKIGDGEEYECDTFWPEELRDGVGGWSEADSDQVRQWTGIEVPQDGKEWLVCGDMGVRLRVRGWRQGG